jgi:hypothetical protein
LKQSHIIFLKKSERRSCCRKISLTSWGDVHGSVHLLLTTCQPSLLKSCFEAASLPLAIWASSYFLGGRSRPDVEGPLCTRVHSGAAYLESTYHTGCCRHPRPRAGEGGAGTPWRRELEGLHPRQLLRSCGDSWPPGGGEWPAHLAIRQRQQQRWWRTSLLCPWPGH